MTASPLPWHVRHHHLTVEPFVIQSHRGAGDLAEENTVEAFELAWKLGTYPEADLRTTKDGVIVPFHDADFGRVVKDAGAALRGKGVKDLSYKELKTLDVGSWKGEAFAGRTVPALGVVFAAMRGRPERHLYMDIKSVDLPVLASLVQAHDVGRQVVLASPSPETIQHWRGLAAESDTLLWMGGTEELLGPRLAGLRAAGFAGITQLQIHIHPNKSMPGSGEPFTLSREFIRELGAELRARGILFQALPYTRDVSVYATLLDLGVASFATDHPEETLGAVRNYYARRLPPAGRPAATAKPPA